MINSVNTKEIGSSLLLNSDDYITISTNETKRKFVNKAYCEFFNKSASELIGTRFIEKFYDEKAKKYKEALHSMTPEAPTVSFTEKYGEPEDEKWVQWKETGIFDEEGKLTEILSIGRNVSKFVEAGKEKENILATLSAFKQAVDTNIICTITDARGYITYANDQFCKISQYSQQELVGKTHSIVNSGYYPKQYFKDLWKTISNGNAWTGELKNKAKDGTYYWVDSAIIPIKNRKRFITGFLSLRILINEQKKLEETKNIYLKTIEDMLFTVSHEIRKPITTCQGLLGLMKDSMPATKEEYDEDINRLISVATEFDSYSRKLNEYLENNLKIVLQ